jgi:DNA-directed RNA polymerase specialized sigma24 family protein
VVSFDVVRRRRRSYDRALGAYRAAILEAVEQGASYAQLARALGVSRQSVRQTARRHSSDA